MTEAPSYRPLLDSVALRLRLDEEVARVRRAGGFLSLAAIRVEPGPKAPPAAESRLSRVARRLRSSIRLHDVIAARGSSLLLLMPETTGREGVRAAERLLALVRQVDSQEGSEPPRRDSAGVAAVYGEVEGGGAALLAAAEEALLQAAPGQVVRSRTLEGRPRVLVVDDDPAFARALSDAISEREWEAHPCSDVADARQRSRDRTYSGFFIDLVLPGTSGVDILREAVAGQPRRPAILMSGLDADHGTIVHALSLGPVMFVQKPISPADLDAALQMLRELVPGMTRRARGAP
ncbi:MAG: hypothetical protein DMF80_03970 [Acidobacteria bacterium]|nr:MAG: hypothetical protein DMF80_03970 [Acidobacteriota bacterium]